MSRVGLRAFVCRVRNSHFHQRSSRGGLAGLASAANREGALESLLVGLISGFLLLPAVFWLPVLLAPRGLQRTEYDFPPHAHAFLWLRLDLFGVIGHSGAKPVPGERRS